MLFWRGSLVETNGNKNLCDQPQNFRINVFFCHYCIACCDTSSTKPLSAIRLDLPMDIKRINVFCDWLST